MADIHEDLAEAYARADGFWARIQPSVPFANIKIIPHWLPERDAFWYMKFAGMEDHEFVFIDVSQLEKRPVFDHSKLRAELKAQGLLDGDKSPFPFQWIDPERDGSAVKFKIGSETHRFDKNGLLSTWTGDFREERLNAIPNDVPSSFSKEATLITFINRSQHVINLKWIDFSCSFLPYGSIPVGGTKTQSTYVDHVWRLEDEGGRRIATFCASEDDSQVVIEDHMLTENNDRKDKGHHEGSSGLDGPPSEPSSSSSEGIIFVREHNVFLRTGLSEIQLTHDGVAENTYTATRLYLSPDRQLAVVWQSQPAQQRTVTVVESSPIDQIQPKVKTFDYLKPGDCIQVDRPRMFNLNLMKEIETDDSSFATPWNLESLGWNGDSTEYRFLYNQRGHKIQRVIGMNNKGQVRTLIEEKFETFVDYSQKTYYEVLPDSDEVLWTSERDGWNHLYRIDMRTGSVVNQITKGQWVVRGVERVDAAECQILFEALGIIQGKDPYYSYLARIQFDGTGLQVLTEGDGTHSWKWSPDSQMFVDTCSSVDMAPKSVLRDGKTGETILELESGSLDALQAVGWSPAECFAAPGRDALTLIYGIIIKPSNFDPEKRYPVIEQIYAGPQDYFCPKAFSFLVKQHELAELGFIIVQIDGMGTNWRHKTFHDVCHKNLKDSGLPDRISWMKAAATTRPWMNLVNVGIFGGSAGGQSAMAAVLHHGDFYKAAAADCGCHDNRMDKIWWNEAWMGWPVDSSYEDSSNVFHAGKLDGALMLLVGELDTNVDPASTFQVVNALNRAQKDYELVVFPGEGHGIGGS